MTVGAIVVRAGGNVAAVREGRVFVGRFRACDEAAPVTIGDEVTFSDSQGAGHGVGEAAIRVLFDEDGLVAVDKPAGMPTIPDRSGSAHSLLAILAKQLGRDPTCLHATSRLDRDVSGVVIFARTEEAARRLRAAREAGHYVRRYVAIAERRARSPSEPAGEWDAPIGRAKDPRHRAVFGRDATEARTTYAVVARAGDRFLLALEPMTGRTHQLRVHAAHAGIPLLGDRTYGGDNRVTLASGRVVRVDRIALHAGRVRVPRSAEGSIDLRADVPVSLLDLWAAVGGEEVAWAAAIEAPILHSR
jgi:RluA family pseudouridine synthase